MWKLYFKYKDGGKITITGKGSGMPKQQYVKYMNCYGRQADEVLYQRYPKKDYPDACNLKNNVSAEVVEALGYYPPVPFCAEHYSLAGICYCLVNGAKTKLCPWSSPTEANTCCPTYKPLSEKAEVSQ